MPKNCILENIYFMLKGDFKKVFRRNTNTSIPVNVEGVAVDTWYYNPSDINSLAKHTFKEQDTKPIGLFIPPSYLEPFFKNKLGLLNLLSSFDRIFNNSRFVSKYSDHYIIALQKL